MTALLLMDFQRMAVDSYAADKEALLGRVKRLAVAARNSDAMVIHVVVGFQLGALDLTPCSGHGLPRRCCRRWLLGQGY